MESDNKTNTLKPKSKIMTLKGYYKSLPDPTYPKKDFINTIAERCNVTLTTAGKSSVSCPLKPSDSAPLC